MDALRTACELARRLAVTKQMETIAATARTARMHGIDPEDALAWAPEIGEGV